MTWEVLLPPPQVYGAGARQLPVPAHGWAPQPLGANHRRDGGIGSRGRPERVETGGRKSEWPIVPRKRGKPPRATPWREGATG